MGRLLLLLTGIAAVVLVPSLMNGAGSSATRTADDTLEHTDRLLVRQVALSGHEAVRLDVQQAYDAFGSYGGPATISGTYDGGSYTADVAVSGSEVTITTRASHGAASHVVRARYAVAGGVVTTPPPFMGGNLIAEGNLIMEHPLRLGVAVAGLNARMHTNGNLEFRQDSDPSLVSGFGTHHGNLQYSSGQTESDIFQPFSNPYGDPLTAQVPETLIPRFNASDHFGLATDVHTGNWLASGTIQLGTQAAPRIWYVGGNFETVGPVTFDGYGIMLVEGSAHFNHDVISDAGPTSPLGIYASRNIEFRAGDIDIHAQLIGAGNVIFDGEGTLTGGITVGGNLEFRSPMNLDYRPAANAITEPVWPGQGSETQSAGATLTLLELRGG